MSQFDSRRISYWVFAVTLLGSLALSSSALADPLNLLEVHPGDVTSHFTSVDYALDADPTTGTLTAIGYPDEFDVGPQGFLSGSSFSLSLKVKRSDGSVVSGSVLITGDTDGLPHYGGTLLAGTITDFGFANGPFGAPSEGNIFEFLVDVTGGSLAATYYSSGKAGIIMGIGNGSGPSDFTGVFTSAFSNDTFSGSSDTFPFANVPEPASCVGLLGMGALFVVGRLRRRRNVA